MLARYAVKFRSEKLELGLLGSLLGHDSKKAKINNLSVSYFHK
jgi:hypothetical protein